MLFIKVIVSDIVPKTIALGNIKNQIKNGKSYSISPSYLSSYECKLLESKGIPCSRSFLVLKTEDIKLILESML